MNAKSMRDAFFDQIFEIAGQDRNVIVISADMGAPALDKYREKRADQFINVGIAEQNMINVAAGLTLEGKKVYVYAIMPFATLRCCELIKVNLSLMNLPVTVVGVGAGFSYDDSGPTHHSTEDISIMRALPNMTIYCPSDTVMTAWSAWMSRELEGPSYIRLDRAQLPVIYTEGTDFSDGLIRLKDGGEVSIIAMGNMVHQALEVASKLEDKSINAGVIDLYRLKPINEELLLDSVSDSKLVLTIEEHMLAGGLGSAVAEVMADNSVNLPLKRFGIPDKYYYVYGGRQNIQSKCGLDVDSIVKTTLKILE